MTLDFGVRAHHLLALLPEAVLALAAMGILLLDVFLREGDRRPSGRWVAGAAVAGILAAAAAQLWLAGVSGPGEAIPVALDGFRAAGGFIVLGAALLAVLFSGDYLEREELRIGEFYALLLLATVGMLVLVAARDLILVFLGLELMSIAVYVLTAFDRRSARSAEAGLKYFLVGAFASAFLLYGIALLYGATGSTHLGGVAPRVAEAAAAGDLLLLTGVGFLLIGFGFKVAAVPFHMWTPDAYEGAPAPVTGFMAAGVKAAAFVALLRVLVADLAPVADAWGAVVWWLAMLTMIVPNLVALAQDNVKRMLAYSSVSHAGYLLVGVAAGSAAGLAASLFYLAVYALMTLGAFAVVAAVGGKGERRLRLADYRGLGWGRPAMGAALVVFLLSLAGFPPTGGFVAKLFLLRAAVEAELLVLAVTLVLTSLVAYYYYFRVVWKMYFEEAPEGEAVRPAPAGSGFRVAAAACALGLMAAGLFPGPAIDRFEAAGSQLTAPAAAEAAAPQPAFRDAAAGGATAPGTAPAAPRPGVLRPLGHGRSP